MKILSPEQWRVLNYLHQQAKLHACRTTILHIQDAQCVTDADLFDLHDRELVVGTLSSGRQVTDPVVLRRLVCTVLVHQLRLKLTTAGRRLLDDPGNQIRCFLDEFRGPVTLSRLLAGRVGSRTTLCHDDVIGQATAGFITVTCGDDEFDVTWLPGIVHAFGAGTVLVTLTSKGRTYLPR